MDAQILSIIVEGFRACDRAVVFVVGGCCGLGEEGHKTCRAHSTLTALTRTRDGRCRPRLSWHKTNGSKSGGRLVRECGEGWRNDIDRRAKRPRPRRKRCRHRSCVDDGCVPFPERPAAWQTKRTCPNFVFRHRSPTHRKAMKNSEPMEILSPRPRPGATAPDERTSTTQE